jgi:hypothetical protein
VRTRSCGAGMRPRAPLIAMLRSHATPRSARRSERRCGRPTRSRAPVGRPQHPCRPSRARAKLGSDAPRPHPLRTGSSRPMLVPSVSLNLVESSLHLKAPFLVGRWCQRFTQLPAFRLNSRPPQKRALVLGLGVCPPRARPSRLEYARHVLRRLGRTLGAHPLEEP